MRPGWPLLDSGIPVGLGGQDEDVLGSLEVGRLGDVVVLNDDYFSVPDSRLRPLHSELTVLGGTVVHSGGIRYSA
jgi:predicted amidohydrolase YtcJ